MPNGLTFQEKMLADKYDKIHDDLYELMRREDFPKELKPKYRQQANNAYQIAKRIRYNAFERGTITIHGITRSINSVNSGLAAEIPKIETIKNRIRAGVKLFEITLELKTLAGNLAKYV